MPYCCAQIVLALSVVIISGGHHNPPQIPLAGRFSNRILSCLISIRKTASFFRRGLRGLGEGSMATTFSLKAMQLSCTGQVVQLGLWRGKRMGREEALLANSTYGCLMSG